MNKPEIPENVAANEIGAVSNISGPEYFLNRELSLLEFQARVLEQAKDQSIPLLERLKFICIVSGNLDEFFEIRVAGIKEQIRADSAQPGADLVTPAELLPLISARVRELVDEQYQLLNQDLFPALERENIRFLPRDSWNAKQANWVNRYFKNELSPVLTPIGLDPAHPFPSILNKSLNFIVALDGKDAFGRDVKYAIVPAPRALPRLIHLPPSETDSGPYDTVFLSSVIHASVEQLFPGMKVRGCYQFRVTRNSDLFVDEDDAQDLRSAMEGELPSRRYGAAVRLELDHKCPDEMVAFLLTRFQLSELDLFKVDGPVNLQRLYATYELVEKSHLKYKPFTPRLLPEMKQGTNLFNLIGRRNLLLHHPFDSFMPVVDFLHLAASDSRVVAIKQTLYRTGADSAVVDALVAAARAGKEVTVVVELRARFDEAENIALANRLQEAGAHLVYGVVGYKTHCKMILIVRREKAGLKQYVHLGTGNYHPGTTRFYTDYGLLTADKLICEDVHQIFMQLTSLGKTAKLHRLLQSPFTLHAAVLEKIGRERQLALSGKTARIIIKINSLVEPEVIKALYQAAQAGVKIDLIIRGICCLKPGIIGLSENIQVRSIVGRFLEHSRVYYFRNGGKEELYCGSADWIQRNFFSRVEVVFPITTKRHRERLLKELGYYLKDNCQTWVLDQSGKYQRQNPQDGEAFSAQSRLLEELTKS